MAINIDPTVLITIGLILDIVGVLIILKYDLGKPLPVKSSKGKDFKVRLGSASDQTPWKKALAGWGIWLIGFGFVLQIIGLSIS
ncbi:hypothetical protein [Pseudohongiella sp. O18]|uniref:hypothetical protein n=1 Tax=Pseudohongiella sp. O18 TaxID=2904248 RepID=UPI001F3D1B41|nr:hypothetical protein [Pseudohongiella sp. O18]